MDKLKDPAMIFALAAIIGEVGSAAYFYKQIESIRNELAKLSQSFTGIVRKITEIEKGDQHKSEVLHTLNDQVKRINQAIASLPSLDSIEDLDLDLNDIVATLRDNNIPVERPSQNRRYRSGDRKSVV